RVWDSSGTPSGAGSERVPDSRKSQPSNQRYRRAASVVAYWCGEQFVLENFLTRRRISADPLSAPILHFFDRYRSERELFALFPDYAPASLHKAVRALTRHSFLERPGHGAAYQKEL